MGYPDSTTAQFLFSGFQNGFKLGYCGPRISIENNNLVSAKNDSITLNSMLYEEVSLGRILGPFKVRPIATLRVNPVGLVPKNTGGFRLITHLSFPNALSVNDFISEEYCHVQYSKFDNAVAILQRLGKSAHMAKSDIKSAFNLCPIWPGDFDLLGIKTDLGYWVQKMLPMGASCSCFIFERFASFIQWLVEKHTNSANIDHLLDDFFMAEKTYTECLESVHTFETVCADLGVPLSIEKKVGPVTVLTFLGLELDSVKQTIKVPQEKIDKAKEAMLQLIQCKKITLKRLQSMVGLLNFICKAIPAGRAFNRRFYDVMSTAKKPHHYIRVKPGLLEDAKVWIYFLNDFNGTCSFNDMYWEDNESLEFFSDASGNSKLGCGCYFQGRWSFFRWPATWHSSIFVDITYLELVPIILAFCLWAKELLNKKIILRSDNNALVQIINKKSSKNANVMHLIRYLVLLSLEYNIQVKAVHVAGKQNTICDAISRLQWDRLFQCLPKHAAKDPLPVPDQFLRLLSLR